MKWNYSISERGREEGTVLEFLQRAGLTITEFLQRVEGRLGLGQDTQEFATNIVRFLESPMEAAEEAATPPLVERVLDVRDELLMPAMDTLTDLDRNLILEWARTYYMQECMGVGEEELPPRAPGGGGDGKTD